MDYLIDIYFIKLNIFSTLIYLIYLELNPKITGIWLRKDSYNRTIISLGSLWNYIIFPFKEIKLWYPQFWDLNIFISVTIIKFFLLIIKKIYRKYTNKIYL